IGLFGDQPRPPSTPTDQLAHQVHLDGAALDAKLAALEAHRSQTEPLADPPLASPAMDAPAVDATLTALPEAPYIDPNAYQVLRPGDRAMSCAQLGAEANTLNAQLMAEQQEQARQAQRARQGRGVAGGVAGGVLGGAARYGLARGMVGGAFSPFAAQALASVADSGSQAVGQAIAAGGGGGGPSVSPQQQRMKHLLVLYREKGC
ncbi:MAG TPA: hypothetical protein PKB04_05860, partial [Phenylobacterium sp.]|nr:hypothetical protein [Phenylobacterium sp.]